MLVVLPVIALVEVVGAGFGDVRLSAGTWIGLTVLLWSTSLPFAVLGVFIGFLVTTEAAFPVVTGLMFVLGYFGGLFTPVSKCRAGSSSSLISHRAITRPRRLAWAALHGQTLSSIHGWSWPATRCPRIGHRLETPGGRGPRIRLSPGHAVLGSQNDDCADGKTRRTIEGSGAGFPEQRYWVPPLRFASYIALSALLRSSSDASVESPSIAIPMLNVVSTCPTDRVKGVPNEFIARCDLRRLRDRVQPVAEDHEFVLLPVGPGSLTVARPLRRSAAATSSHLRCGGQRRR